MSHPRFSWIMLAAMCLDGCAGGDASDPSGSGLASGSTTSASTGVDPDTSNGSTTMDSVGATSSTGSGPADSTSGETTGDGGSGSSSDGCIVGTEGCPCDAGACEGELICVVDEICQPAQCDGDMYETNEDESTATFLGEINDNDANGDTVSASLHLPDDVDWFYYQGDDDFGSTVNPERELIASAEVRMCKFIECDNGLAETDFECPAGTDYALSPMARAGCCTNGDIALPDLNCTGVTEDNAMIYIRIDQPAEACVNYSVSYHY